MAEERIEILYADPPRVEDPGSLYAGFCRETVVLPEGYVHEEGRIAFPCDTIYERDVPVKLRDGVTIYADIYRPVTDEKLPVILSWGCSGKRGHNDIFRPDEVNSGISRHSFSGLQAWSGADPAHWVQYGYAVAIPDPRGTYMSEGDIAYFGSQDANDCCDFIEWLAERDWCSGKIGMCGSAWYGMTQWNVAAIRPKHLTCIAPWCAHGDIFTYEYGRGGIYKLNRGPKRTYGQNKIEDIGAMSEKYPLRNSYWQDKAVNIENIDIPVFCSVALTGFTSDGHMAGTFDCFRRLRTGEKWLKAHPIMNFADLYYPGSIDEMRAFYDHYLKGADNGWEDTPHIRMCTFDTADDSVTRSVEETWPPKPERIMRLGLDAGDMSLRETPGGVSAAVLDGTEGSLSFAYTFARETVVTGYMKLHLELASEEAEDMDVYVQIGKLSPDGKRLSMSIGNYAGPNGRLRISRRHLDESLSTELEPVQTLDRIEPLVPGERYSAEVPVYPTSMVFHPGEKLELTISGVPGGHGAPMSRVNRGKYEIFCGDGGSYLALPVISEV